MGNDVEAALEVAAKGASHRRGWRQVSLHRIERDRHLCLRETLLDPSVLLALDHGAALVLPALGTGAVRQDRLAALRGRAAAGGRRLPVRAALIAPLPARCLLPDAPF